MPRENMKALLIKQCNDGMMWYANKIGKLVPYRGTWKEPKEYRSRDNGNYTNIVKFEDADIVEVQPKGSMCCSCQKRNADCRGLDFASMPIIKKDDNTVIVKCTEFENGH